MTIMLMKLVYYLGALVALLLYASHTSSALDPHEKMHHMVCNSTFTTDTTTTTLLYLTTVASVYTSSRFIVFALLICISQFCYGLVFVEYHAKHPLLRLYDEDQNEAKEELLNRLRGKLSDLPRKPKAKNKSFKAIPSMMFLLLFFLLFYVLLCITWPEIHCLSLSLLHFPTILPTFLPSCHPYNCSYYCFMYLSLSFLFL